MVAMDLRTLCRDGIFRSADAAAAGIDGSELRRLRASGECHRLLRGWYSVEWPVDDATGHRLRTTALVRHLGRVCPSHHSLLILRGLPTLKADLACVHLTRLADTASRHRTGAVIHPQVDGPVTLAQAIVQTGQLNGPLDALVAADAALHRALVTADDIERAVARFTRHPHSAAVRRILALADARTESPGETLLRRIMLDGGLHVTPQHPVQDGSVTWRADFVVDGTMVLVEFDGLVKYAGADDLVAEKRREDRLRALGYEVVRVMWADLEHPERILRAICQAIARSRRAA